jgi:hypothetical protein
MAWQLTPDWVLSWRAKVIKWQREVSGAQTPIDMGLLYMPEAEWGNAGTADDSLTCWPYYNAVRPCVSC